MNSNSLIRTKFQRPAIGPDILSRARLTEQLENGRYRKLTLISAPAGYGKSILGSLWQGACKCQGTWLTLDKNDNDPGVFISYFISSLQTIFPESFPETAALLAGQQLPALDMIATSLLNEATSIDQAFIIILDDYHVISNQEISQLISTLIQYLPANMHLAIITRQDPPLDIVNLRAKDQLTEIRMAELRFSEIEVKQFLQNNLGDTVSSDLAHKFLERTEGWPAGLRLAELAVRNQVDQDRFLEAFQGTNQFVMSYLVSEVLSRQPEFVRSFLLQTSLLDRFCAPLCEAILVKEDSDQHAGSQDILDRLILENLFLIPLDHQGKWFRYHHLFQDLLRHELSNQFSKTTIRKLHIEASSWLAGQGFIEEALDHAFLANNMDQAVQIVAKARFKLMCQTRWQRLEQLLHRFPQEIIHQHPDLFMAEIWIKYQHFQLNRIPAAIDRLEKLISEGPWKEGEYKYLIGEISGLRSLLLYFAMDIKGVVTNVRQALDLTVPELWNVRVLARLHLAGTQLLAGDLNSAYDTVYQGFEEETDQSDTLKATVLVTACYVSWIAGDVSILQQNASQVIRLSQKPRLPGMLGYGHYFLGMVSYHQNDLAAAKEQFSFVHKRPYATYNDSFVYSTCGLALAYHGLEQERDAVEVVDAALAYLLKTGSSEMLPVIQAFKAELALRQGQIGAACQWAKRLESVPPLIPMPYLYVPHMTLVKVWLAEDTPASRKKAADLLAQLKEFLEFTHNTVHLIETMALMAVSRQMDGDESAALAAVEQAMNLGLPEKFIRVFVDLGPAMGELLNKLVVKNHELATYKDLILAAMPSATRQKASLVGDDNGSQPLVEPLTDREMDVLILLNQRQTDKEIAENLVISPSTVRTHTKNIYTKLGVNNRRQAAVRAEELGLLVK